MRPMAEYACAIWENKMTIQQEKKLEIIQLMFLKKKNEYPNGYTVGICEIGEWGGEGRS